MNQAKQAVNPDLPTYEYVPDGEPHVPSVCIRQP